MGRRRSRACRERHGIGRRGRLDRQPAVPGEQGRVVGLDGMAVDRLGLPAGEHVRDGLGEAARAIRRALTRMPRSSPSPVMSAVTIPPRGAASAATRQRLRSSLTAFFGARRRGASQRKRRAVAWRSGLAPRSPRRPCRSRRSREPAAPNASRQNCSRAEAEAALFLIRSMRRRASPASSSPSSTSRPLMIAPTGLITSWQTREHSRRRDRAGRLSSGWSYGQCLSRGGRRIAGRGTP